MNIKGNHIFTIVVKVDQPVLIGQDETTGRRQLIPIISGKLEGTDPNGHTLRGDVLGGGVDSQVIRPDGVCELSARYGVRLNDGRSFYVENNGIRTVPDECVEKVLKGEFIDPELYYFCTSPKFEVFAASLEWLKKKICVCKAVRLPDEVQLHFYQIG